MKILQKQYCFVFSDPDMINVYSSDESNLEHALCDISFGVTDNIAALKLQNNSVAGHDSFHVGVLKRCHHHLAFPLGILWMKLLDADYTIEAFVFQSLVPVVKKGSNAQAVNYPPISLTSHLIKLFVRAVRFRVTHFLEINNFLVPKQHSFRDGTECLTQSLYNFDDILNAFGE